MKKEDRFRMEGYKDGEVVVILTGSIDALANQYLYEKDNYLMKKDIYVIKKY